MNRAARLEPLAPPGEVLIDAETRALVGESFELERLADVTLKGFARPQAEYRVAGEAAAGRGATSEVGAS